jgi:hypothetical protein
MPSSDCLAIWIRSSNLFCTVEIFFLAAASKESAGFSSRRLPCTS